MCKLKKVLRSLIFVAIGISTSSFAESATIKIAASALPHAEILEFAKPYLLEKGIDLQISTFNDFILPNDQLAKGAVHANYIQFASDIDDYNHKNNTNLVNIGGMHIEPFGMYSTVIKDLTHLPQNATIAIPLNDIDCGRALLLLAKANIIELNNFVNPTLENIISNPKNIQITQMIFGYKFLIKVLLEHDLVLFNYNYALSAGFDPTRDSALLLEDINPQYINVIATTENYKNLPELQTLIEVLHSNDVREFILDKYQQYIIPAF